MSNLDDKRSTSDILRQRLNARLAESDLSRAGLALAVGVDRSTITQLLSSEAVRLPNAHLVASLARVLGVSSDWLLGLSEMPQSAGDTLRSALGTERAQRALLDETILGWHREAEGYKIRHVPATLPDMLKTTQLLRWDVAVEDTNLDEDLDTAVQTSREHLAWMRTAENDYEIALPQSELNTLSKGAGYYQGLEAAFRQEQLLWMADLAERLYPTLRIFVFDPRVVFSAPITIYGPRMAALYVGHDYLTFRDRERVRVFIRHFDWLVRAAMIPPDSIAPYLRDLAMTVALRDTA